MTSTHSTNFLPMTNTIPDEVEETLSSTNKDKSSDHVATRRRGRKGEGGEREGGGEGGVKMAEGPRYVSCAQKIPVS